MNGTFFCNKCGAQNAAGAQFCSRCGAPTVAATSAVPPVVPGAAPGAAPYYAPPAYPGAVPVAGFGYGGFWIRVVAAVIDSIVIGLVASPFWLFFGGLGIMHGFHPLGLRGLGEVRRAGFFL